MAVMDSLSLVMALFFIALIGWFAEFYLYIASEVGDGLTTNPKIIEIKDNLVFFASFVHSNFFAIAIALSLTNLIIASRTSLNPVWSGLFAIIFLLVFWLLDKYIVPMLYDVLIEFETGLTPSNLNWAELFRANWYIVAISGLAGTILGYIRGVRNELDYSPRRFRGRGLI